MPEERTILGYLFPDWPRAMGAMRALAESEATPSVTRVSDAPESAFSFATRKRPTPLDRVKSAALQQILKRKGIDAHQMCLSFIGFEGSAALVKRQRKLVAEVIKPFGGFCIGSSPGELYDQKKFDTPYIRDFLLDRGGIADVSETSAPWAKLEPLYDGVCAAARSAFDEVGVQGWIMCHLSHSYHSGACLYFTFAFKETPGADGLKQYDIVKSAIQQAFMDLGATLSHHHAVGVEHAPWLEQDISPAGVAIVRTLLDGVDPGHNLNPGKIVPGP
jgi:alkyldihydroxyacetonephosphate synthase